MNVNDYKRKMRSEFDRILDIWMDGIDDNEDNVLFDFQSDLTIKGLILAMNESINEGAEFADAVE